jgi:LysM repeat protein
LEQQSRRRSHLKLGVLCVLLVGSLGLVAMLIQGCKREQVSEENPNTPPVDTNAVAAVDTNPPPAVASNVPPVAPPPVVVAPPVVENPGVEYTVARGDTLGKIARKNHVTLSALKAANPGVDPAKLKAGQKITLPAGGSAPASTGAAVSTDTGMAGETYVVKSGDSLTKIAKKHGVSLSALKAANNLNTDHIKVGQKLKLPVKAEAAAPAPVVPAPVPAPAPAPAAGTPVGQ